MTMQYNYHGLKKIKQCNSCPEMQCITLTVKTHLTVEVTQYGTNLLDTENISIHI
jgi:hypothetical protein